MRYRCSACHAPDLDVHLGRAAFRHAVDVVRPFLRHRVHTFIPSQITVSVAPGTSAGSWRRQVARAHPPPVFDCPGRLVPTFQVRDSACASSICPWLICLAMAARWLIAFWLPLAAARFISM